MRLTIVTAIIFLYSACHFLGQWLTDIGKHLIVPLHELNSNELH